MAQARPPVATIMVVSLATLSGLFGPQAFAPLLAHAFSGGAAQTGVAINTIMLGMAIGGLLTPVLTPHVSRVSVLAVLLLSTSLVTTVLARCNGLEMLAVLRCLQGVLMCGCFATTMAYVAETWGARGQVAALMAAYVTGNVMSNILGRVVSGWVADRAGWPAAFLMLAAIQLAGAVVVWRLLPKDEPQRQVCANDFLHSVRANLCNPTMLSCLGIGFLIMFMFSGVFTFANFRLSAAPFLESPARLGEMYLVFLPAILTTPFAARTATKFGYAKSITAAAGCAFIGLLLTLNSGLVSVLFGMMLIGMAAFYAQALATSYCGMVAQGGRTSSAGLYLASYYTGGLAATVVLGPVYETYGWTGLVAVELAVPSMIAITAALFWNRATVAA